MATSGKHREDFKEKTSILTIFTFHKILLYLRNPDAVSSFVWNKYLKAYLEKCCQNVLEIILVFFKDCF